MSVVGDSREDIETFIGEMATPIPTFVYPDGGHISKDGEWKTEEVVFSFWNAVAPQDLKAYFTGDTWYNWNCANWGVKWDAKLDVASVDDLEVIAFEDKTFGVNYHFETAWGTPSEFFRALARKYPHLTFSIEFEEEQGWGGEFLATDGELSLINEYDIPNSHADYEERDREDSCLCAHESDPDDMFEDCPPRVERDNDPNNLIAVADLTSLVG